MSKLDTVELRRIDELRPHPENAAIFGDPEGALEFDRIVESIRKIGLCEPIIITPDSVILSGHRRVAAFRTLGRKEIPARVLDVPNYRDQVERIIRFNTDRMQLTKAQIAKAFSRLKAIPRAEGGTARKRGKPRKDESAGGSNSSASRPLKRSDDETAELLGVKRDEARSLDVVFNTPGVPDELKDAVERGAVKPTPAAKAVRSELKRQNPDNPKPEAIQDPTPLRAVAEAPPKRRGLKPVDELDAGEALLRRSTAEARWLQNLLALYRESEKLSREFPLATVSDGNRDTAGRLMRDISIIWWRQVEGVYGQTDAGKQMVLVAIDGGKKS